MIWSMKNFTFIDLFAGLGGFRIALESLGGHCVFSSEINSHACTIYEANFGENPCNDITKISEKNIPDFDILCAGFPCQAFSIAGKKKGFEDTRGTLFFDVCRIIKHKKPSVLLLENVKNLITHDSGKTFETIISSLKDLGYQVSFQLLNAKDFGLPQHRERIIIVAVREDFSPQKFQFNLDYLKPYSLKDMFDKNPLTQRYTLRPEEYTIISQEHKLQKSGLIFCGYRHKNIRKVGVKENSLHLSRVHKQPNRIYSFHGVHPTLSSQESSGRYFVYDGIKVIKLTLEDCFFLMGFPSSYIKVGSQANLYNRIGNSVCVPMIQGVMKEILKQFF